MPSGVYAKGYKYQQCLLCFLLSRVSTAAVMGFSTQIVRFLPLLSIFTFCPSLVFAQTACNGHTELCSRKYSNVTQIGAHDSAFVGTLPQDNQDQSVTDQLNAGIRFLQAQSHMNKIFKTFNLCHTSCFLEDAGPVSTYLSDIKSWLDANPSEVVTLVGHDSISIITMSNLCHSF